MLVGVWLAFALLWWEATPLVGLTMLFMVPIFLILLVFFQGIFGRWNHEPFVVLPVWQLWWLFWLAAVLFGVAGLIALIDGRQSRAAFLLLLLALLFALRIWVRGVAVPGWLVSLPILFAILGLAIFAAVLATVAAFDGGQLIGVLAIVGALVWILTSFVIPAFLLRPRPERLSWAPGLPLLFLVVPIAALLAGIVLASIEGIRVPSGAGVELNQEALSGSDGASSTTSSTTTSAAQATTTTVASTTTTEAPEDPAPPQQTYRLKMSDGSEFPIYVFNSGTELARGVVVPRQDDCWIIQYDAGDADRIGDCKNPFVDQIEPAVGSVMFSSETHLVVLLRPQDDLVVTDLRVQGVAVDLDQEFFVVIDASTDEIVIDDVTFLG